MTRRRLALAVIAKEPVAGLAKTRLAPALGERGAATVAAALLADTVATVATVGAEPWLCFAPAAARERMAALAPGFRLLPQAGGDLGDRLAACAAALHTAGATRLAIVGADTPHLPAVWQAAAFALLGLGLRAGLLPPLRDLDRIEDLEAALDNGELASSPRSLAVVGALLLGRRRPA